MPKKEFTTTEVMVLQESMDKKLNVIGEHISYIVEKIKKIDKLEEDVSNIKEDIHVVKLTLTQKTDKKTVDDHEVRIVKLEKASV